MQLRVLLVRQDPDRGVLLKQSLQQSGHNVVAETVADATVLADVEANRPDLLVVDTDTPGDRLLARLDELSLRHPLPIVLFAQSAGREMIRKAVRSGVSACVVDGLDSRRVAGIVEVAVARFGETGRLRRELYKAQSRLLERKTVERAKSILMRQRGFDEPQAYHALRKMAMDKNLRIGEVAENLIAVADLLN